MAEEEKQRVEKQREKLGANGLKEKGDILEKATDENEVRIVDIIMVSRVNRII